MQKVPSVLEIRWQFAPESIFEEPLTLEHQNFRVTIDAGTVVADVPIPDGQTKSGLRVTVEAYVHSLFQGVQLVDHVRCQVSAPSLSVLHEDGSRNYIIECQTGTYEVRGGRADLRYTNSDGEVVDTRRDRIERKQRLSQAAAKYGPNDVALARMLRSYQASTVDKTDELIHLYEVLDTLKSTFGNQQNALKQLGVSKADWSRLGQICNHLPLLQGRHRGDVGQALRSASEDELIEARKLTAGLIETYIAYLDRDASRGP